MVEKEQNISKRCHGLKFDLFANNLEFKNQVKDLTKHFGLTDFTYNLVEKIYQENALRNTKKLMSNDFVYPRHYKKKKVVFNVINGIYGYGTFFSGGLAKALQLRGHQPLILTCGNALSMCTAGITIESPKKPCKNCVDYANRFYKILDIPHKTYFDYISRQEIFNIETDSFVMDYDEKLYKGVNVAELAKNSADRYFEGKLDKIGYNNIYRQELLNAVISVNVAEKLVEQEKPDVLISQQQHFSAWGGIAQYCRSKGIRTVEPAKGYDNNTVGFDIDKTNHQRFFNYYNSRKPKKLSIDEGAELWQFSCRRTVGEMDDVKLFGFTEKELLLDSNYEKTYTLFTNIPYDTGLLDIKRDFKDVYDWINFTIDYFKNKPEHRLIIKIHPIEKVVRAQNTISDYIKQNIKLTDNIKIISADTKINPYALIQITDVGILYSGTLGIELSLQGKPVILVSDAHYANKGFTFDAHSKKEYEKLLSKNLKVTSQRAKMASVYAYYYFIKTFIPVNWFYYNNFLDVGWDIKSIEQLAHGEDKYLDTICDYIVNGGVYQKWK